MGADTSNVSSCFVDGEDVLRKLAATQVEGLQRTSPARQLGEFKTTHAYLSGALAALHEIGALGLAEGFALMDELLNPVSSALERSGQIERVEVTVTESSAATGRYDPRGSLVHILEHLQGFGVVADDEMTSIKRRIDERFPDVHRDGG